MLSELTCGVTVLAVTGYTDMRKGIDGLASVISGKLSLDPYSRSLFLFCGRNAKKLKGLLWEGDGFLLLNKRLENGRYRWPRNETEAEPTVTVRNAEAGIEVAAHKRKPKRTHEEMLAALPTEEVIHEVDEKAYPKL